MDSDTVNILLSGGLSGCVLVLSVCVYKLFVRFCGHSKCMLDGPNVHIEAQTGDDYEAIPIADER